MNKIVIKFAASSVVIAIALVGCQADSLSFRPAAASASVARPADEQAARLVARAREVLLEGKVADALVQVEKAVALAPRDLGYRMTLADLYLRSGRFESAATTYGDVLDLQPGNSRAALSFALMQTALGRPAAAVAQLDAVSGTAAPADVGLAYALAGQPERAIALLEPAARAPGANARLRQNLALAFALAGDWQRARAVAAQDVSPAELTRRMEQWARFAQPRASWDQVAHLLGVQPAVDSGQPVHLALRPEPAPVAFAEAAPAPVVVAEAVPEPVRFQEAPAAPAYEEVDYAQPPIRFAEAAVASTVEPSHFAAVESEEPAPRADFAQPSPAERRVASAVQALVEAEPAVLRAVTAPAEAPPPVFERAPRVNERRTERSGRPGRFVVQIGAFSSVGNAERAWLQAERRYGLAAAQPLTTTVELDGRVLHRVSVSGFADRAAATRLCGSIRTKGGACFVRATAGDAPVQWASRNSRRA